MKKIEILDYNIETARFYSGKELILEIINAQIGYNNGEFINIEGIEYLLHKTVSYPEISIVDYHLMEPNNV